MSLTTKFAEPKSRVRLQSGWIPGRDIGNGLAKHSPSVTSHRPCKRLAHGFHVANEWSAAPCLQKASGMPMVVPSLDYTMGRPHRPSVNLLLAFANSTTTPGLFYRLATSTNEASNSWRPAVKENTGWGCFCWCMQLTRPR
jgi:hypothetical protein